MTPKQCDNKMKLLENQVKVLRQSFDTVQIFCTKHEEGDDPQTYEYQSGEGNFMARYGQVRAWILHEDARNSGFHNEDKTNEKDSR